MKIENLSNNMLKPNCLETLYIKDDSVKVSFQLNGNLFNLDACINLTLINDNNDFDYNPLSLINYFNSFNYLKVVYWDDDKEFDFSSPKNIIFTFNIEHEFLNHFLNNIGLKNIKANEILNIIKLNKNEFENNFINFFLEKFKNDTLIR